MHPVAYFKAQAKKLHKDYKRRTFNEKEGFFEFPNCQFFDLESIFLDFDLDYSREPSLMGAQHIIALISGLNSWDELIHLPENELAFLKLQFENQNKISLLDWREPYIGFRDQTKGITLESEIFVYEQHLANYHDSIYSLRSGYLIEKDSSL